MTKLKRIVIVGATSAIAAHCARLWLQQEAVDLVLVGRHAPRLDHVANDLRVRSPQSAVQVIEADLLDCEAIQRVVTDIAASARIDIVLIAHGALPDQAECQINQAACHEAIAINGTSPVLWAEAFASDFERSGHGTLVLIGSVAGDRGRQSNYVYGAAKGMLARYAEGLQHRFAGTRVKVVLIKPGPTDTPMTAHLKNQGAKLASVESVARHIVSAAASGKPLVYTPRKWWLIMRIIQHLPRRVFSRLKI